MFHYIGLRLFCDCLHENLRKESFLYYMNPQLVYCGKMRNGLNLILNMYNRDCFYHTIFEVNKHEK